MDSLFLPICTAAGSALTAAALFLQRREHRKVTDLIDQHSGRLHRGKRLRLDEVHPGFTGRVKDRPTLLILIGNRCSVCHIGLAAVVRQLPEGLVNVCIVYNAVEGFPDWLEALGRPEFIVCPVTPEFLTTIHTRLVPRWILLSPSDRVLLDHQGYLEGLTVGLILKHLKGGSAGSR